MSSTFWCFRIVRSSLLAMNWSFERFWCLSYIWSFTLWFSHWTSGFICVIPHLLTDTRFYGCICSLLRCFGSFFQWFAFFLRFFGSFHLTLPVRSHMVRLSVYVYTMTISSKILDSSRYGRKKRRKDKEVCYDRGLHESLTWSISTNRYYVLLRENNELVAAPLVPRRIYWA